MEIWMIFRIISSPIIRYDMHLMVSKTKSWEKKKIYWKIMNHSTESNPNDSKLKAREEKNCSKSSFEMNQTLAAFSLVVIRTNIMYLCVYYRNSYSISLCSCSWFSYKKHVPCMTRKLHIHTFQKTLKLLWSCFIDEKEMYK